MENFLQTITAKIKLNFLSSLVLWFLPLVLYLDITLNKSLFLGIILYYIPGLRTYFLFLQLVNAVSFSCKQILLFVRSEVTGLKELEAATRGVLWNKLFLKMSQIHKKTSVLETVFNTFAGLTATLLKRDTSTGVFLLTFLLFWNLLWTAASKEYVIGVTDRD